ncbi:MFS transporter [Bradyrhizobium erythrophlei]|uniref:MFS transporter n=1 Tax=Bradyrhizobium erythrophlei TaxID=1437360 RepID=UPI0035EC3B02
MTVVRPEKGAWGIVALLFLFMMINFADKAIIGLAGVPIMTELNLTPKQFGVVGSSFFLLFSISAVVTGFIVNRIRSKWVLLVMGLVWALVQFPMLGTVGVELLIACRIILGAGEGPAYPVALHAAYKWFPDQQRAIPSAIIAQGAAVGVVIAIPLLNAIITNYNWHYAFGALGVVGLAWVAAWALIGKEGRIEEQAVTAATDAHAHIPYRDLLLSPTNLASWCAYFGAYFGLALVLSWFTPYLVKGLGFEQSLAGKLTALPFIVGFFVVVGASWLSQRMMQAGSSSRAARGIFSGVAICLGGLALLAAPYAPNVVATLTLIVAGTTLPSVVYVLSPAILGEITPSSQRGAVLAINSAVGTSAGIVAPYIMGSMIEGAASAAEGYSQGFMVCGAVTLIGGVIGLAFLRPEADRAGLASRANARVVASPA